MNKKIAHRGPDGEGYYVDRNIAFGHRRLAIIDLSKAGHQPMRYVGKNGEYIITYNGEVYNYIELRQELREFGYEFKSNTDTEVILASYDKWGVECLNRFNGMWAFVIYDKSKNILFGARDRFGVKPFYYINNEKFFAFASEIKALLPVLQRRVLNENAVVEYLMFGMEREAVEEGFFKGVFELLPSHAFTLDLYTYHVNKWKYFNLELSDCYEKFDNNKLEKYAVNLRRLIFRAIEIRLRSDVTIGSCLSGGLDSSTIVCVISDILKKREIKTVGKRQKVFTAVYKETEIDESRWAKMVVDKTKAEWHKVYPNDADLMEDLTDLVYTQEIPFGSTSIYAQYRVMKLAREMGVKVLLDGQGGDELFTGYTPYYATFFRELLANFDMKALYRELRGLSNSPVSFPILVKELMLKHCLSEIVPKKIIYFLVSRFSKRIKCMSRDLKPLIKESIYSYIDSLPKTLNEHLYKLLISDSLRRLLRYEDRNSMRFGIEARVPFADDIDLIKYAFKIPSVYKIHSGWSKYILRVSMNGILPHNILNRRDKIGFATPERVWFSKKRKDILFLLLENRNLLSDFVSIDVIIEDLKNNEIIQDHSFVWRVLNLALWRCIYGV